MSRGRKILLITGVCSLVFLLGAWGLSYGLAERGIQISPKKGAYLSTASPVIEVSWPFALGARLLSCNVLVDGDDVSNLIEKKSSGFEYSPPKLPDGGHVLDAELTYWWLIKRRVKVRSYFTTDNIDPEIEFSHSSGKIAVPRSWIHNLEGSTEPGSKLKVSLNGRKLSSPDIDETGHFSLGLYQLQDENELSIIATDQAGNTRSVDIPVVIDRLAPIVRELSPPDGKTVHSQKVSVAAYFEEGDSEIRKAVLRIDNKQVYGDFDSKKDLFTYKSNTLAHGEHKAVLEVTDAAGNSTFRRWSFTVDTTRLVLSVSQRKIFFYRNGELVKTYRCAVGQPRFPTPKGHWKVVGKRRNPAWYNPGSGWSANMPRIIPPGPSNPLGTRAIEINASAIRFHGTPNTGSIGRAASHGCIRMYRKDVEELFDEVTIGVPVDIVN